MAATVLEVLAEWPELGWRTICHPPTLEDAIADGMKRGNGLYVWTAFGLDGLQMKWFGLHNGEFAGINPYGWHK